MIRFLKAIRQKSLAQNNVIRYLLYATGEIVLVVIGILIALAITDWNDTRKKEQKIKLVFEDILSDLASDINYINNLMEHYEEKDTLINLVLNGNLTYEDYYTDKMPGLWGLTTNYSDAILIQNGYNNLIQDLDAIPLKYKPITKELNILYGHNKHRLLTANVDVAKMVDRNIEIQTRNYPWYSSPYSDTLMRKQQIQYYLTDFKYRNEVETYWVNGLYNHLPFAMRYRATAIECYKKIATLLNKHLVDKSFELDADVLKIVLGDWKNSSDVIISIYTKENKLLYKNNVDTVITELYPISKTKIVDEYGRYAILVKEKDTYFFKPTRRDAFEKVKNK